MILIEELFKVHILLDFNGHATQSSVSTNLMFSQSFFMHQCCNTKAHCSLLDIYISQKTRLCVVNLEDQFQTCLEAKLINFLIWKFRSIILIFLLFFAGVVKSSAFCKLLLLLLTVDVIELQYFGKTSLGCEKHWI